MHLESLVFSHGVVWPVAVNAGVLVGYNPVDGVDLASL